MKNSTKLFVFTVLLVSYATECMNQRDLFDGLKREIITHVKDNNPTVDQAVQTQIAQLTNSNKNDLLGALYYDYTQNQAIKRNYTALVPYLKEIVLLGANPNHDVSFAAAYRATLLSQAAAESDLDMVKFLVDHGATGIDKRYYYGSKGLLHVTKSYPIAEILVKKGALIPYLQDLQLQKDLLFTIFGSSEYDGLLIKLYEDNAKKLYQRSLNFKIEHPEIGTLLHQLAAHTTKQIDFFEKFRALLKAGAVDLQKTNAQNERPIDIVERRLCTEKNLPALVLAQKLLTDLQNTPGALRLFNPNNKGFIEPPARPRRTCTIL